MGARDRDPGGVSPPGAGVGAGGGGGGGGGGWVTAAGASSWETEPNLPSLPSLAPFALTGAASVAAFSSRGPATARAGAVVVHDVSCPAYEGESAKLWP